MITLTTIRRRLYRASVNAAAVLLAGAVILAVAYVLAEHAWQHRAARERRVNRTHRIK